MKNLFTILLGITCAAVLIYGQSYWNQRIKAAPSQIHDISKTKVTAAAKVVEKHEPNVDVGLLGYTANWPTTAVEQFKQALSKKKPFKILFVGSPAIGSDTIGTYPIVKDKLLATLGEKNVQVAIKTYNSISTSVIKNKKQDEIAAEEADLIILEPFILLNNGNVLTQNTFTDMNTIIEAAKAKNPNSTVIIQPSYPIYKAKIYPRQVELLKQYAEKQQLPYLDHWTAWPDATKEAFKEYVTPDQSAPSEKGNQLWSKYLLHYLLNL